MKPTLTTIALALFILGLSITAQPSFATNLCKPEEVKVFSCKRVRKKPKYLSLCATKDWGPTTGRLTYRYGRKGKVELAYPASPKPAGKSFVAKQKRTSKDQFQRQVDKNRRTITNKATVAFQVKDTGYEIFDQFVNIEFNDRFDRPIAEDEWVHNQRSAGINITLSNKKVITIHCKADADTKLASIIDKITAPPKILDACQNSEKAIFNCNKSGKIGSLCKMENGKVFARFKKGESAHSFEVNPNQSNPILTREEHYIRDIGYIQSFLTPKGKVVSNEQERYQGITVEHYASQSKLSCTAGVTLQSIFPEAPTKLEATP